MNEHLNLRTALADEAEDAPSPGRLIAEVNDRYRRRLKRRRHNAVAAAALGVVALVSAIVITTGRASSYSPTVGPPAADSSADEGSTMSSSRNIAGGSAMTTIGKTTTVGGSLLIERDGAQSVTSPISVPQAWVSFDNRGPGVSVGPQSLSVRWTGADPNAMETINVTAGTTGKGQVRGYTISVAKPSNQVYAPGYDTNSTVTRATVHGRAAELVTAPKGSEYFEPDGNSYIPAQQRLRWQLSDGRWIEAYTVGEPESTLAGFAAALQEKSTALALHIGASHGLRGFTAISENSPDYSPTRGVAISPGWGPSMSFCQALHHPIQPDGSADSADQDLPCINVSATVLSPGFLGDSDSRSEAEAETTADRRQTGGVTVYYAGLVVWRKVARGAAVVAFFPPQPKISAADMTEFVAGITVDTALPVDTADPDAIPTTP